MKPQRISSKDYEELLKIMRRWVDPYRTMVAKLIGHIAWQFEQIKKLEEQVKQLQQQPIFPPPDPPQRPWATPKPFKTSMVAPKDRWPLARRLSIMVENGEKGSKYWTSCLRWNELSETEAMEMVEQYNLV